MVTRRCDRDSEDEQAESEERIQWNQSDTNLQLAIMFDEVEAAVGSHSFLIITFSLTFNCN